MADYTECNVYQRLVKEYSPEKQKALQGREKIKQEIEIVDGKIKEIKQEGFLKRMKRSSELKEFETRKENLRNKERSLVKDFLMFLQTCLPQCVHCRYQYCPYQRLITLDYGIWSRI